jgi:hypothetical protein
VDSHYVYGVSDLENLRDRYPQVCEIIGKNVFNRKLGRKYFRLGLYFDALDEAEKAREAYGKAMELRKFRFRYAWRYYRATCRSRRATLHA